MTIHIHIERLILDGLPLQGAQGPQGQAAAQAAVWAAVQAELARLFTEHGPGDGLRTSGAVRSVQAPRIELATQTHPDGLGQQIARAVYTGIAGGRGSSDVGTEGRTGRSTDGGTEGRTGRSTESSTESSTAGSTGGRRR